MDSRLKVQDNSYGQAPLQEKMLGALVYFIELCNRHELRYYLAYGTCLGALRHKGFIPWDDDLDVCMPREDYERLWSIAQAEGGNGQYAITRTERDKNYHHRVIQIVDKKTTFIHSRSANENIEHGVYIDVIPLDNYPASSLQRILQAFNAVVFSVYNIQNKPEYNGGRMQGLIGIATSVLLCGVKDANKRYRVWKTAERRMIDAGKADSPFFIDLTGSFKDLFRPIPKRWFQGHRVALFEDVCVEIPTAAEEYCRWKFGNFEQLPPENMRHARHNTVFIDLERSYTDYYGVYYCIKDRSE